MYGTCCLLNIYHDLKDEWKFVQAWTLMRKKWFSNACSSHTQFCSPITLTLLSCCKRMSAHSCTNKIRSFGEYVFTYAALTHTKYVESWAIFMNHITIFKPSSWYMMLTLVVEKYNYSISYSLQCNVLKLEWIVYWVAVFIKIFTFINRKIVFSHRKYRVSLHYTENKNWDRTEFFV